jgi:hypothetical protein
MTRGARFAGVATSSRYTGAVTEALADDPYAQERLPCILPGCRWALQLPAPQDDPRREEIRRAEITRACERHVSSHPAAEWMRALADAQAEITRLRGEHRGS